MRTKSVLLPRPRSSTFNLSHNNKFTCDMGVLVPFLCEEVAPNDHWQGRSQFKIDFMPQIKPVMHNVNVHTFFFYVPNRILWDDWKNFLIGGTEESNQLVPPYVNLTNVQESSLADYIGVPTEIEASAKVSALPFRAYQMIWNNYFRNEDIQEEVEFSTSGGEDTNSDILKIKNICWQKDYFTTATKSQQFGDEVTFSLSGDMSIERDGFLQFGYDGYPASNRTTLSVSSSPEHFVIGSDEAVDNVPMSYSSGLKGDLSSVDPFSISLFRQAMLLQSYYEKLNVSGHRYNEFMKAVFGVTIPDATLSKPEYLGGGKSPVLFSPVLQSSETTSTSPQGNQSGFASAVHTSHSFNKRFDEHGFIIGLFCLRPQSGYYQGIKRGLTKDTRFDYLIPDFVGLSEQPIYNKELYFQGNDSDNQVFGYQERYSEYKAIFNSVHGQFRSSLDYYHMDRKFSELPTLSDKFVECDPTTRIFAVENVEGGKDDHIMVVAGNSIIASRQVPKYSLPSGLINKGVY